MEWLREGGGAWRREQARALGRPWEKTGEGVVGESSSVTNSCVRSLPWDHEVIC